MTTTDHVRAAVRRLKPGEQLRVTYSVLRDCEPPTWLAHIVGTAADQILSGIIGSAYELWYQEDPLDRVFTFGRLDRPLEDGRRTYVAPDRRHLYQQTGRFWIPLAQPHLACTCRR